MWRHWVQDVFFNLLKWRHWVLNVWTYLSDVMSQNSTTISPFVSPLTSTATSWPISTSVTPMMTRSAPRLHNSRTFIVVYCNCCYYKFKNNKNWWNFPVFSWAGFAYFYLKLPNLLQNGILVDTRVKKPKQLVLGNLNIESVNLDVNHPSTWSRQPTSNSHWFLQCKKFL